MAPNAVTSAAMSDACSRRKRQRDDDSAAPAAKRRAPRGRRPEPEPLEPLEPLEPPAAPEAPASPPRSPPTAAAGEARGSPTDVAEAIEGEGELRRPRTAKARASAVPELAAAAEQEFNGRPVAQNTRSKATALFGAGPGIVRAMRRRRRAAAGEGERALFRLPTSADLARASRSGSSRKPPRPVPATASALRGDGDGGESGEETEPEEAAFEPPPDVRVEAVVDVTPECSGACPCLPDDSCDDRCAAYSSLPFPGFAPCCPLLADGDEFGAGLAFY